MNITEGYIPYKGYRTYYRIVGESNGRKPLLALHGGPGAAHDYLESLDGLAEKYGRQVIYYDQIGAGKSQIDAHDPAMWNYDLYLDELETVIHALGLEETHILGQSWGGMLLMKYMLRRPEGVSSIIISSSPANSMLWVEEANRLIKTLPFEHEQALNKAIETSDYSGHEYFEAYREYGRRYICNFIGKEAPPYLDGLMTMFDESNAGAENESYVAMQGHGEFEMTGVMKDYNVVDQLCEIKVPALVISGNEDECTPLVAKQVADGIPGAVWALIPGGTHLVNAEQPELYNEIVESFIRQYD